MRVMVPLLSLMLLVGCSNRLPKEQEDLVAALNRVVALAERGTTQQRYQDAMVEVDAALARVKGRGGRRERLDKYAMVRTHLWNASRHWDNWSDVFYEDKISRSKFMHYGDMHLLYPDAVLVIGTHADGNPSAYAVDTLLIREAAWGKAAKIMAEINRW